MAEGMRFERGVYVSILVGKKMVLMKAWRVSIYVI